MACGGSDDARDRVGVGAGGHVNEPSIAVLIGPMHPALEGVVRLAAGAVPGVDQIIVVESGRLPPGSKTRITIAVVDLIDSNALVGVRAMSETDPDMRIVALADRLNPVRALDLMRLGAYAFIRTDVAINELPETLGRVGRGERVISPEVERLAVNGLGLCVQRARSVSGLAPSITERERQVLELVAEGFTIGQIGRRLGISPRTVEAHVAKLYRKLTVRTRLQAITRGSSLGLIELG